MGHGLAAWASGSNPAEVGSTPTAPAIYIDADTGAQVTQDWWPGMDTPTQLDRIEAKLDALLEALDADDGDDDQPVTTMLDGTPIA